MKFRKKPVVISAQHVLPATIEKVAHWCGGELKWNSVSSYENNGVPVCIDIPTLEGTMRADMNDWVIKGVKGEFYPIKAEIFKETYEPVE